MVSDTWARNAGIILLISWFLLMAYGCQSKQKNYSPAYTPGYDINKKGEIVKTDYYPIPVE